MAPAFPLSGGHRLSASEASVSHPSRPPPCLRLPTPAGDPPSRSPICKKRSPSVLPSVSMFCSSLAATPLVPSEPATPRNSSPRYELAAVAFLSTGPLCPKAGFRPPFYSRKLPDAIKRPSSPLPCKAAARVSGTEAKSTPQNFLPLSPPSAQMPRNSSRRNRFTMTRSNPQVASPVPRKSGSSRTPPALGAPNPTIVHTFEQEKGKLHPQTHAVTYQSSPSSGNFATYAFKAADAPRVGTSEGAAGGTSDCVRSGLVQESSCTGSSRNHRRQLGSISSTVGDWKPFAKVCSATPVAYTESSSARPLQEEENPRTVQRTLAGEAEEDLLAKRSLGENTYDPCDWIRWQRSPSTISSACWHDKPSSELQPLLPVADYEARETAQPAAVAFFPATTCVCRLPVTSRDSRLQQHQRTYLTNCAECAADVERDLPKSADGESLSSAQSEPKTILYPAAAQRWQARRQRFFGERGTDTEEHQGVTQLFHGICRQPRSSTLQMFDNPEYALRQTDRLSFSTLETHSSHGGSVVVAPLPRTEEVRNSRTPSFLVPHMTHSNREKVKLSTERPPATLHPRGSAEPFPTKVVAGHPSFAAAPSSAAEVLGRAACGERDTDSDVSLTSPPALYMTAVAATGLVTDGERTTGAEVGAQHAGAATGTGADVSAFLNSVSIVDAVRERPQNIYTSLSTGTEQAWLWQRKIRNGLGEYCDIAMNERECHFATTGGEPICEHSGELSQAFLEKNFVKGEHTQKAMATDCIAANAKEAFLFAELQHTLRELQAHGTALRASEIVFDMTVRQNLAAESSGDRTTENSGTFRKRIEPLLTAPGSNVTQVLQYRVLEEGSFGKVFVGRFLGKLPTDGGRRWWRTLPLCERFLQGGSCGLPFPATGFLPSRVQDAMENNVKVAIKVPVEAMVFRDPLGVLARTLNEWKILVLVHEKRKMLFSRGCGRDDGIQDFDGMANRGTTRSGNSACRKEARYHTSYGGGREGLTSVFCQDQLSAERVPSLALERWHPMHPQAEPPGVVELVGGVVHGPLDVWLVTRLAAGKDLHTRKYTKSLADGISIPPAAGLAMCRQLAAIVDFLHAGTKHREGRQCVSVAVVHSHRNGKVKCRGEQLKCGGCRKSDTLENTPGDDKAVTDKYREIRSGEDFSCSVSETPVIVHRDIKPENIIVDDNWRIQLCDFGDAEASPDGVVSRVSGATWLYAPVELLCAAPFRATTDEQGVDCGKHSQRECGRRSGALSPCTHAKSESCGNRARSCPIPADVEKQPLEGCMCSNADCNRPRPNSSSTTVGAVFTEKWDIWSMGCVFQEMFGLPNPMSPYVAPTDPPQVVYEKLRKKARCGQLVPFVAPQIQGIARQIIFACLRSDPQARPSATAVLRMWSAPEREILKDIRLPASSPPLYSAPYVGSARFAIRRSAAPQEFCPQASVVDMRRAFTPRREHHKQTRDRRRNLYKSVLTPGSSEARHRCAQRVDGDTATGRMLNHQDEVYVVPNLAIVPDQYNSGVNCTDLAA